MKKVISAVLTVIMLVGMITAEAYEYKDSDILIIDTFDQLDDGNLEDWFVWLPMDTYNHKTYHDMLESDFARTLHELLIPFDVGVLDTDEAQIVLNQYGLTKSGLEKVYYLNEIQQTFNAVYNANIDFSSLDGLLLDGSSVMARVIDNYFILYQSPHGTIVNPNPKGGTRLGSNSEYWTWYYGDDFSTRDYIYTIITRKNVAGYDVRTIDYISFTPPSDEILDSYAGQNSSSGSYNTSDVSNTPIRTNLYGEYLKVLNEAVDKYGEFEKHTSSDSTGVGYVKLVDFDNDGISELLFCTGEVDEYYNTYNTYKYEYHIYGYNGSSAYLITEGSMKAHSEYENWEITLLTSNYDGKTRLSKSTGSDVTYESEGITFYEYDGGLWQEYKDIYDFIAVETGQGTYYFEYYIHGEKVTEDEYSDRFYSIFQGDKIDIKWTDFSGSYLEEVGTGLSDMNYWLSIREPVSNTPISVTLNGNIINFDQPPIMQNDRTLVPIRAIFEALGATVTWDDYTETVTATRGYVTINITIGEYCMYKNGNYIELDVPAMLLNDRTLVPVRAISEAFNCIVDWNESSQTVIITTEEEADYNQEDLLRDFLYNRFEQQSLSVQANVYFDIDEDNEYISLKRSVTSYEFIDLDNDGMNELIISSGAIIDDDNSDEYIAPCISVWDCDDNGDVVCALAKSGQESRMAYRYFVIRYLGNIYLLESTGESNSDGHTSVRNLYEYSGKDFCFTAKDKVYLKEKLDSAYASEERFTVNGENKTREYAQEYINGIDQSEFLYRQFN